MRIKKEHWITYEDLERKDLVHVFSIRFKIEKCFIEELLSFCDTDFRFRDSANCPEYKKISGYVDKFWKIKITPRQIRYIHKAISNQNKLKILLKRGGKMRGTFRDLVLRNLGG